MASEFSRTLALLRKEKGVTQHTAAAELGISQALLSHYEKGIREPGLPFVVKACDYYNVSADFILGRTLSREGSMLTSEEILNTAEPGNVLKGSILANLQSKLFSGAAGVLFELLGKLGDREAINAVSECLGGTLYQLYRALYAAAGQNESYFSLDAGEYAAGAAEADIKRAELRYRRALRRKAAEKAPFPDLSPAAITKNFPGRCQSLTQILSTTDSRIHKRAEEDEKA